MEATQGNSPAPSWAAGQAVMIVPACWIDREALIRQTMYAAMNHPSCVPAALSISWATSGAAAAITAMPNMPTSMLRTRVRPARTLE